MHETDEPDSLCCRSPSGSHFLFFILTLFSLMFFFFFLSSLSPTGFMEFKRALSRLYSVLQSQARLDCFGRKGIHNGEFQIWSIVWLEMYATFRRLSLWSGKRKVYRTWGSLRGGYEDFYLRGYNTVQSVESQLTFRRNMSPPPSGSKSNQARTSVKQVASTVCFNELHGDIFQKIELFITTAVRTSNPTIHSVPVTKPFLPRKPRNVLKTTHSLERESHIRASAQPLRDSSNVC
jgi:hypothetical protein